MADWAGFAVSFYGPGEDGMESRLPTELHPLAGRFLAWHVLRALAESAPPPRALFFIPSIPVDPELARDVGASVIEAGEGGPSWPAVVGELEPEVEHILVVDAAAATLGPSVRALLQGPANRAVVDGVGRLLAAWVERSRLAQATPPRLTPEALHNLALEPLPPAPDEFLVRDRTDLARATAAIRDRVVQRLMRLGVTFVLPDSVMVDLDVEIGPDSVIFPGVVLEGKTTIGRETVVGPCCRIIDSRIGSGVELKGWNYISGTEIRNRAVLEPYVRRGFD